MLTIIRRSKPATDEMIKAFEDKIGYKLPSDYVKFLKEINGGYLPEDAGYIDRQEEITFGVGYLRHISDDPDMCLDKEKLENFQFHNIWWHTNDLRQEDNMPDYFIDIAKGGAHEHFLLNLKDGMIYFYADDGEECDSEEEFLECLSGLIIDSFETFFSGLEDDAPNF